MIGTNGKKWTCVALIGLCFTLTALPAMAQPQRPPREGPEAPGPVATDQPRRTVLRSMRRGMLVKIDGKNLVMSQAMPLAEPGAVFQPGDQEPPDIVTTNDGTNFTLDAQPATLDDLKPGMILNVMQMRGPGGEERMSVSANSPNVTGRIVKIDGSKIVVNVHGQTTEVSTDAATAVIFPAQMVANGERQPGGLREVKDLQAGMVVQVVPPTGTAKKIIALAAAAPDALAAPGRTLNAFGPTTRPASLRPAPPATDGPTVALDGTIYELRLPPEQISRIDIPTLTAAAATPAAFEKALAEMGQFKSLYRVSQSVRLAGDYVRIGATVPMVTDSRTTDTGQVVNNIMYMDAGTIINLAGKVGADGRLDVNLSLDLIVPGDLAANVPGTHGTPGTPAPPGIPGAIVARMRRISMAHKGLTEPARPVVLLSADATFLDATGKAVAYVARCTLGPPSAATQPAGIAGPAIGR